MLCDKCKERPATVYFVQTINNKSVKQHLCQECANKAMGLQLGLGNFSDWLPLFASSQESVSLQEEKSCPLCHTTYADFAKSGKLGCSQCYTTFAKELSPLLYRLHATTEHRGKKPNVVQTAKTLQVPSQNEAQLQTKKLSPKEKLQKDLAEMVAQERYEEAAIIRDKIKEMEKAGGE